MGLRNSPTTIQTVVTLGVNSSHKYFGAHDKTRSFYGFTDIKNVEYVYNFVYFNKQYNTSVKINDTINFETNNT